MCDKILKVQHKTIMNQSNFFSILDEAAYEAYQESVFGKLAAKIHTNVTICDEKGETQEIKRVEIKYENGYVVRIGHKWHPIMLRMGAVDKHAVAVLIKPTDAAINDLLETNRIFSNTYDPNGCYSSLKR